MFYIPQFVIKQSIIEIFTKLKMLYLYPSIYIFWSPSSFWRSEISIWNHFPSPWKSFKCFLCSMSIYNEPQGFFLLIPFLFSDCFLIWMQWTVLNGRPQGALFRSPGLCLVQSSPLGEAGPALAVVPGILSTISCPRLPFCLVTSGRLLASVWLLLPANTPEHSL